VRQLIDGICANTPAAKGRVERARLTLQERLVKELRLEGIPTLEDANAFMPRFTRSCWVSGRLSDEALSCIRFCPTLPARARCDLIVIVGTQHAGPVDVALAMLVES
jgi:hypothetical protein